MENRTKKMRPIIFSPPLAVGVLLLSALLPSISTGCDISSHVEHRHASRGGRTGSGGATATTAYCCASLTRVGRRRVIPENASRSCGTGSRSTAAVEMRRASSGGSSDNADRGRPRWVPGSGIEKQQRRRQQQQQQAAAGVSRAFNRVVGSILSKGDMFGSLGGGGGVGIGSRNNFSRGAGRAGTSAARPASLRQGSGDGDASRERQEGMKNDGDGEEEKGNDVDIDDDDDDGDEDGDDDVSGVSLESLSSSLAEAGSSIRSAARRAERPMWRRMGQLKRSRKNDTNDDVNRLLKARTSASSAVVVDGPFAALESFMTVPVSEYSVLDSSILRRISDSAFRFQIPLKHFVGLDLTPTMEVEVEVDPKAQTIVFRSTGSTLYGDILPVTAADEEGEQGEKGVDYWPGEDSVDKKLEYFRVGFDARLRWAKGDASTQPRRRLSRGGFSGKIVRRPRATSSGGDSGDAGDVADEEGGPGSKVAESRESEADDLAGVTKAVAKEVELRAERGTLFCDTQVRVQVLLPPPVNTLLPGRLMRALLGKVLSTIVSFVLPRFLELLADEFYDWQSGTRRAPATSADPGRTLLGARGRLGELGNGNPYSNGNSDASSMTGGGAGGAGDSESPATAGNGDCADSTDTSPNSRIPEGLLRLPAIPFNGLLGGGGGDTGDSSDSGDAKGSEAGDSADGDSNSNKARGVGGRLRNLRVGGPRRWGNNVEPAAAGGGGAIGGRERGGATTAPAPPACSGGKSPKLDEGSGRGKGGTSGVGLEPAGDDGAGIPGQIGDALRGWAGAMTGGGGGYDSVRSVSVAAAGDPVEYEDDLAEFIEDVGEDGDIGEGGSVGSSDNGRRRWGRGLGGPNWWG